MKWIDAGGVSTPQGYQACGVHAGVKPGSSRADIALVCSSVRASTAAVYTTNQVQAAPIVVDRAHLHDGMARAVVLNSGNANACTGAQGQRDAERMCALVAAELGCEPLDVLVCSTGVIGVPLPMDAIEAGMTAAVAALAPQGGAAAARAIMTTDTVPKSAAVELDVAGTTVRIGGMAKGAGMIAPDMATMLSVLTTDAAISPALLQELLAQAAQRSFNCVTVDGDMSTNDTLLLMANGAAGGDEIRRDSVAATAFSAALTELCLHLARAIARDGEGATKLVTITVRGAPDDAAARQLGRSVANSSLVKTAIFGNDPNWGRILCAMGYSGVPFDVERAAVSLCGVPIYEEGGGRSFAAEELSAAMKDDAVGIDIDLGLGAGSAQIFTCDLSYDYVRINAEYTT